MQLDKIAIRNEMLGADLLTVKNLGTPHACKFQATGKVFVHEARDIVHRATTTHREGLVVIRRFTWRLCVDTDDLQRAKKKGSQLIQTIAGFG